MFEVWSFCIPFDRMVVYEKKTDNKNFLDNHQHSCGYIHDYMDRSAGVLDNDEL